MNEDQRVAIVTGGAKGIGLGIVSALVSQGVHVAIADIDADAGARLEQEHGSSVSYFQTNIAKSSEVRALIEGVIAGQGRIDILVNNAGYHISKSVENTSEEEWEFIIATNLTSTFLCSKYAIPHLRHTRGCIVNISSMVGLVGQRDAGAYAASKGGQIAMTRNMALDLAADGIRVNAICPGWVRTPLVDDWFSQQSDPQAAREYIEGVHPLGRIASVDEIARAVLFLTGQDSSFITGTALEVDGGVTLGY